MKRTVVELAIITLVAGCASSEEKSSGEGSSFSAGPGSPDYTVYCPSGLMECQRLARQYCGEAGYREVRQLGSGGYTTAGSGDARTEELLSRTDPRSAGRTSMTVRCKPERPGSQ